jgi:hypothetical protein
MPGHALDQDIQRLPGCIGPAHALWRGRRLTDYRKSGNRTLFRGLKIVMANALEGERPCIIAADNACKPLICWIDFHANSGF